MYSVYPVVESAITVDSNSKAKPLLSVSGWLSPVACKVLFEFLFYGRESNFMDG